MKTALAQMGDVVPLGPRASAIAGVATVALFMPMWGLIPNTLSTLALAYSPDLGDTPGAALGAAVTAGLAPFFFGRVVNYAMSRPATQKHKRNRFRGLKIGPVNATERDLYTSMLVLGATGTGKTSRILFPALEDLINTYSDEDDDIFSKNPYQKAGGFILEVKGKFFETIVLLVHRAGRNSSTDVRVIRANSTLPLAEFKDEQGRVFVLNAQPCSTGSEVSFLYKDSRFKDGSRIESTLFKRIRADDLVKREEELKKITVKVHSDVRFIGWRWKDGKLHGVKQTLKRDEPEYTGQVIDPPKTLTFFRRIFVSNGLQYNLLDPQVPPSEAAERIAMVAKMVTGEGKGGGDNQFFYSAASKLIDSSIRLCRIIEPEKQATVLDVYRIIAFDSAMQASLNNLKSRITAMQALRAAAAKAKDTDVEAEYAKTIQSWDDLSKFFTEEWMKLKSQGNTGQSIMATISNLFGPFMRDPALQETFCMPATFDFRDCMQKGTIFAFVPGPEYELQARLIGTVLKMDWQSRMLQRVSEGSDSLNKNRVILHVADECQAFIVAGSQDAGDPKFMSLSRESKVMNICATQSEAWVFAALTQHEARVWIQSFGTRVWLTQTDEETNKRASILCGQRKKEKRSHTEQFDVGDLISGKEARAKQQVSYEDKPVYEPHDFSELKEDEAICYNKGEGMLPLNLGDCKALKGKVPWRWITGDQGVAEIADRMRWWFVETWENDLCKANRLDLLDPMRGAGAPPSGETSAPASVVATDTPSTPGNAPAPLASYEPAVAPGKPAEKDANSAPTPQSPAQAPYAPSARDSLPPETKERILDAANNTPGNKSLKAPPGSFLAGKGTLPPAAQSDQPPVAGSEPNSPSDAAPQNAVIPDGPVTTPAEIARQCAAYKALLETNPFSLISYEDAAGLDALRSNARMRSDIPGDDLLATGKSGVVGGSPQTIRSAASGEGSKPDAFRLPPDMLADDSTSSAALHRRIVSNATKRSPTPASIRDAAKQVRGGWTDY